jgi:hypothetical protein
MRIRYYLSSNLIILALLLIISCLNEPEYLKINKTEIPRPTNLEINQTDAFSLVINWLIPIESSELITQFKIETFALDSQMTITNDEFTSHMQNRPNSRDIKLPKDNLLSYIISSEDSIGYSFVDTGSIFNSWNYYRITVLSSNISSYSHITDSGFIFKIDEPRGFNISQISDFQLQASWNRVTFADGYELVRYNNSGMLDTFFIVTDTSQIDSSYNPMLMLESNDIIYAVDGLQPNAQYKYSVRAFSDNEIVRRYSHQESSLESVYLRIKTPKIKKTRPKNSRTTRIYIPSSSLDANIDSIFVFRFNTVIEKWSLIDTEIVANLDSLIDIDMLGYHVLDVQNEDVANFIILAKGEVNGLISNDTLGNVYPYHNCERIEGGYFNNSSFWINSFYLSSVEYVENHAFIDKSLNNVILNQDSIFPTDSISWVDAVLLCNEYALNMSYSIRLPSEMEWEYAALKNVFSDNLSWQYDYPWGSDLISSEHANYINSGDLWDNHKTPVAYYNGDNGTYNNSSTFGIFDLAGNILEWCGSGSHSIDLASINMSDSSIIGDPIRELRGGGYWHEPNLLKSNLADEFRYNGKLSVPGFGFRILIEESE